MSTRPPESALPEPGFSESHDPRRRLLEETIGSQYEILRQLGQGGAGVVYLARERLLERLVAIKLLRSEFVSADSKERFVREARTAAKLMHAHVVPLYSFGQAGDTLYYIMGYVEGESLEAMLQRVGRCEPNEARRILVEVADALDYAHRSGVIHRDVKPDNILIERGSRKAILTDFGIAKVQTTQSTLTATGMIVGTPLYMSPEQAAGDSAIDGRSDLYSLGVIGYRMVSGRLPIEGSSAQDVMRRHVMQDPQPLSTAAPTAPLDLTWAVMRCLDKDPTGRWPSVEAFRQALEGGEESVGDLPEPLEHLSGLGVRVGFLAWIAAVIMFGIWAGTREAAALVAAVALPLTILAALAPGYLTAKRFGLTQPRIHRLLATPPERLSGWWPARWRRAGDVWERLPLPVRRFRAARSAALAIVAVVVGPALVIHAASQLAQRPVLLPGALPIAAAAIALIVLGLAGARNAGIRMLQSKGIVTRQHGKWLREPTWGSPFWRRPEVALLLAEPARAIELPLDSPDADSYCATTPTQPELPQGMFDHVDPRSPTPLYAQIASRLRVAIASGELHQGDGLPSVRQLAGRLRINPATVVQAYRELEVEGLVSTRHGAGTFVQDVGADRKVRDRAQEARRLVRELLAEAGSIGITATELRAAMDVELKSGSTR